MKKNTVAFILALSICPFALGWTKSASEPKEGIGRFQLFQGYDGAGKSTTKTIFKIDTLTGRAWVYNWNLDDVRIGRTWIEVKDDNEVMDKLADMLWREIKAHENEFLSEIGMDRTSFYKEANVLKIIEAIKNKFPQYREVESQELAVALEKKFPSLFNDFSKKVVKQLKTDEP